MPTRVFVALCLLLSLFSCRQQPETAESVIARVVSAHGGEQTLAQLDGLLFHGHIHGLIEGEQGKLWLLFRRPDRLRVVAELERTREDRIYRDGRGWLDSGRGMVEVGGMALDLMRFQADHLNLATDLARGRYRAELLEEVIVGKPVRLQLVGAGGEITNLTLTSQDWLIKKVEREIVVKGKPVSFAVVYDDYRAVKGVQLPFRILNFIDGKQIGQSAFQAVQINPSLPERVFSAPSAGDE